MLRHRSIRVFHGTSLAKADGWKESGIVDNPSGVVNDVLSIWRSR